MFTKFQTYMMFMVMICRACYVHIDSWPSWGHHWLLGEQPCGRQETVHAHLPESSQKKKENSKKKMGTTTTTQTFWRFRVQNYLCLIRRNWSASIIFGQTQKSEKKQINRILVAPPHAVREIPKVSKYPFCGGLMAKSPKPIAPWLRFVNFR